MNDIDFIKKSVPFSDFYQVTEYPNCTMLKIPCFEHDFFIEDYGKKSIPDYVHSHFLTRTIEGMEKTFGTIVITQHVGGWAWNTLNNWRTDWDGLKTPDHKLYKTPDEAKQSAIEYVLENK